MPHDTVNDTRAIEKKQVSYYLNQSQTPAFLPDDRKRSTTRVRVEAGWDRAPETDIRPMLFARGGKSAVVRLDDGAEGNTGKADTNQVRVL